MTTHALVAELLSHNDPQEVYARVEKALESERKRRAEFREWLILADYVLETFKGTKYCPDIMLMFDHGDGPEHPEGLNGMPHRFWNEIVRAIQEETGYPVDHPKHGFYGCIRLSPTEELQ